MPPPSISIPTFTRGGLLLPIAVPLALSGLAAMSTGRPLPQNVLGQLLVVGSWTYLIPYAAVVLWYWRDARFYHPQDVRHALALIPSITVIAWALWIVVTDLFTWALGRPQNNVRELGFAVLGLAIGYFYALILATMLALGLRFGVIQPHGPLQRTHRLGPW